MENCYLWRHRPIISAPLKELLFHFIEVSGPEVFEKAVFLLENDKFLYIRYFGPLDDENKGVTDIEEFDTENQAKEVFDEH